MMLREQFPNLWKDAGRFIREMENLKAKGRTEELFDYINSIPNSSIRAFVIWRLLYDV